MSGAPGRRTERDLDQPVGHFGRLYRLELEPAGAGRMGKCARAYAACMPLLNRLSAPERQSLFERLSGAAHGHHHEEA